MLQTLRRVLATVDQVSNTKNKSHNGVDIFFFSFFLLKAKLFLFIYHLVLLNPGLCTLWLLFRVTDSETLFKSKTPEQWLNDELFSILSTSVPTPPGGLDTEEEKDLLTQLHSTTTLLLQMDQRLWRDYREPQGQLWGLSSDFFFLEYHRDSSH